MIVETKNASLDTMAVTIHALHVSGKQMTLAVFRQLPVASMFLDSGERDDSLHYWGVVRYKIGDDKEWVVAERDGRLFRCNAYIRSVQDCESTVRLYEKDVANLAGWNYSAQQSDATYKKLAMARVALTFAIQAQSTCEQTKKLPQLFIAV